jgi:c(7)-type cytochrome triheme protein
MGLPAVAFDHWRHRAMYTCRVCHVDLGFSLRAGETEISAQTNEDGTHCGACHDGKTLHKGRPVFRACSGWPRADAARGCTRCHTGASDDPRPAYEELARRLPADAAGDIAWAAAVQRGLLEPRDTVEGVEVHAPAMRIDRDVTLGAKGTWMETVTFSHRKHAALNGCELCHPEIFPATAAGTAKFRMGDVAAGEYCGVCHRNVAFPLDQCKRCHADEKRRSMQ